MKTIFLALIFFSFNSFAGLSEIGVDSVDVRVSCVDGAVTTEISEWANKVEKKYNSVLLGYTVNPLLSGGILILAIGVENVKFIVPSEYDCFALSY